ncbi:hypothetical protein CSV69_10180 [Sporosarcina sp. P26b]|uniref:hypothetical protein n=1 Tax=Sporosarcina sp. P26b TaxID=2048253 RepID=UPI000C16DB7B|nr:hypothetical protein [Sporosarcina sp. P26b]PIC95698.1 hypothetical protein CSV69_10180 [Sporosarcina sp. P26b]
MFRLSFSLQILGWLCAINATQVEVKFSQKVDATEANKQGNYTLTSLDGQGVTNVSTAVLQDDEKTVVLTADKALEKRYQLTLGTDKIESAANSAIKVNYNETVTFAKDTTAPKVIGTERVSANQVKVKFSEPVYFAAGALSAQYADSSAIAIADIQVGGANINVATVAKAAARDEITLELQAGITADKDIVVTLNGVKDTADNLISPQPSKVTVVKKATDTVAPKLASVTQTGAKTFNIKFDKPTTIAAFTADKTEVEVTGAAVTGFDKVAGTNDEYKVTVDTNLNGLQTVTVKSGKATNADGTATAANLTKLVTFVADEAAPKATSKIVTDSNNNQVIELTFDKDVELIGDKNVTVKGTQVKDYVTIPVNVNVVAKYANNTNKKVVQIPLSNAALNVEGALYNLTIENKTANTNGIGSQADVDMAKAEVTFTRNKDGVAPNTEVLKVADIVFAQGASNDAVTVTFSNLSATRALDAASASNVANYSIDGAVIESATVAAEAGGSQVVTLKLKKNSNTFTGVRNATVKNVKLIGSSKVMNPVTQVTPSLDENVRPTVEKAEITANNEITLTFSEAVTSVNKDAFLVKAGTATVAQNAAGAVVDGSNAKKVTITLGAALTPEQLAQTITVEPTKTSANFVVKDLVGNELESFAPVTVAKP